VKRIVPMALGGLAAVLLLSGCTDAATTANDNLSKAADNFEVPRRIVGINGITDKVLFTVEGFCSITNDGRKLDVLCKTKADGTVERTTLGLSDNVTYVSTQLSGVKVDLFKPRVIFRPETIIPNVDLSISTN
jgi:protein involved in sex pheromone biosynthesis